MRIVLTGAAGAVGTPLGRDLKRRQYEVLPVDIADSPGVIRIDLRNADAVAALLDEYCPDVVLHLAANKNVFFCEENKAVAHETNFGITENLARACMNNEIRMVFLSTDYVFGAGNAMHSEASSLCPTTQYGRDKAASEEFIKSHLVSCSIVRSAGLYGFPGDLVQVIRQTLAKGNVFNAFGNLKNCPTAMNDLSSMLDIILTRGLDGTYHCVGPEVLSRFDYAVQVARVFGFDESLIRLEMLDFSRDIRPPCLHLDGKKTYSTLDYYPRSLLENIKMNAASV